MLGYAALNRIIHHATWAASVKIGKQLATLCGQVAIEQVRAAHHYVIEQPAGSALFQLPVWKHIAQTAFWRAMPCMRQHWKWTSYFSEP